MAPKIDLAILGHTRKLETFSSEHTATTANNNQRTSSQPGGAMKQQAEQGQVPRPGEGRGASVLRTHPNPIQIPPSTSSKSESKSGPSLMLASPNRSRNLPDLIRDTQTTKGLHPSCGRSTSQRSLHWARPRMAGVVTARPVARSATWSCEVLGHTEDGVSHAHKLSFRFGPKDGFFRVFLCESPLISLDLWPSTPRQRKNLHAAIGPR